MSNHNDQRPDLVVALKRHHLAHDTPSQLSDAFRLGWDARADLPPTPRADHGRPTGEGASGGFGSQDHFGCQ
jgi:hypothetical protein